MKTEAHTYNWMKFSGLIQVNNWKPIPFEAITDNQEELAANLFKEISNSITVKILTKQ